jgi:AraC-like DNA-binding protein
MHSASFRCLWKLLIAIAAMAAASTLRAATDSAKDRALRPALTAARSKDSTAMTAAASFASRNAAKDTSKAQSTALSTHTARAPESGSAKSGLAPKSDLAADSAKSRSTKAAATLPVKDTLAAKAHSAAARPTQAGTAKVVVVAVTASDTHLRSALSPRSAIGDSTSWLRDFYIDSPVAAASVIRGSSAAVAAESIRAHRRHAASTGNAVSSARSPFLAAKRWASQRSHKLFFFAASATLLAAAALWLLLHMLRNAEKDRFMTNTRLSIMDNEVQLVCRYIEKHYHEAGLTTAKLCQALTTGEAFVQALFERELGMSVEEFIDQVRINRARKALDRNPMLEPGELWAQNGFSGAGQFLHTFQRIVGVSFAEYRTAIASRESQP